MELYVQFYAYDVTIVDRYGRLRFEWDPRKDKLNLRKHGISFATAKLVFDDPEFVTLHDREVGGELRWQTIGLVRGQYLLLVVHAVLEEGRGELVRIISARKATRMERRVYEEANGRT